MGEGAFVLGRATSSDPHAVTESSPGARIPGHPGHPLPGTAETAHALPSSQSSYPPREFSNDGGPATGVFSPSQAAAGQAGQTLAGLSPRRQAWPAARGTDAPSLWVRTEHMPTVSSSPFCLRSRWERTRRSDHFQRNAASRRASPGRLFDPAPGPDEDWAPHTSFGQGNRGVK